MLIVIKRLPWLRKLKKTDVEPPVRLPANVGSMTNGEGWWPEHYDIARARVRQLDEEWGPRRDMLFATIGPRNRRDLLQLRAAEHREKLRLSGNVPNRIKT